MQRRIFFGVMGLVMISGLTVPKRVHAWGDLAHQVICEIAFQELTQSARDEVKRLIQQDPDPNFRRFSNSCTWADHPRKRRDEHFLNLPRTHTAVTNADQTCPLADTCLLTAIEADTIVLKDTNASDADKLKALKFLGHWMGDLHQPLHISFQDDRGGNEIGETGPCKNDLHAVWDTCLITRGIGPQAAGIVAALRAELTDTDRQAWTQGDMVTWANESYQITISPNVQYCMQVGGTCQYADNNVTFEEGETQRMVTVKTSYIITHTPTVRSRLLKAGVRLGYLLNGILVNNRCDTVRDHKTRSLSVRGPLTCCRRGIAWPSWNRAFMRDSLAHAQNAVA